jgi:hypothetical protein
VVEIASDMVALHATDPASVFLAVWARGRAQPDAMEAALYDDRTLLRMLGMRRTMFVVALDLAAVVHSACTKAIAVRERAKLVQILDRAGIDRAENWLAHVEDETLRALAGRGEALASELAEDVPALREQLTFGEGTRWAGRQAVSTRVLFLLAADARIVRGRPRGSWTSSQHRWTLVESWLPGGIAESSTDAARVELVRRWLATYGPATIADLKWWTGLTLGQVRRALAIIETEVVELESGMGLALAGDLDAAGTEEPWVALLPALDPTVMGWAERSWYLGDHERALFDRSGNAGPTVWCDGRIVGGWAQRKDGTVVTHLLEDVGTEARAAIDGQVDQLHRWLGPVRVTPRFRTPLERQLST